VAALEKTANGADFGAGGVTEGSVFSSSFNVIVESNAKSLNLKYLYIS
jgi:hypothetical protein